MWLIDLIVALEPWALLAFLPLVFWICYLAAAVLEGVWRTIRRRA